MATRVVLLFALMGIHFDCASGKPADDQNTLLQSHSLAKTELSNEEVVAHAVANNKIVCQMLATLSAQANAILPVAGLFGDTSQTQIAQMKLDHDCSGDGGLLQTNQSLLQMTQNSERLLFDMITGTDECIAMFQDIHDKSCSSSSLIQTSSSSVTQILAKISDATGVTSGFCNGLDHVLSGAKQHRSCLAVTTLSQDKAHVLPRGSESLLQTSDVLQRSWLSINHAALTQEESSQITAGANKLHNTVHDTQNCLCQHVAHIKAFRVSDSALVSLAGGLAELIDNGNFPACQL